MNLSTTAITDAITANLATLQQFDASEVLLGYQKRWIADASPLKIAEKSRRTGITWAEAADAALCASMGRASGGCNHFYIGSNKEMAREFIEAVGMWARAFDKAAGEVQEEVFLDEGKEGKEILTYVIYFASGFKVQALSSNPSNLRGMQGNVTIDEAAFHERLAEVLKAALALTMWGCKVRLISTHNGTDNLFNQLIQDSRAGRKRYSVHTISLDDACVEGLYKRICQVRKVDWSQAAEDEWKANLLKDTATEEDALEEYFCVPKQGSGAFIPRGLIDRAMSADIPVVHYEAPQDFMQWTQAQRESEIEAFCIEQLHPLLTGLHDYYSDCFHAFGADFARSGDLSVFCPGTVLPDTRIRVPFLVELRDLTYDQQRQIAFYVLDNLPRLIGAAFDATGNGGYLAEAAALRYGTDMVDQVHLSVGRYRDWMPKFKARFEDSDIEIPKTTDVQTDLRKIQMNRGVPQIEKGSGKGADGKQRHGDAAVALCMMNRATYMEGGIIEFTPLPSRHPDHSDDDDNVYDRFKGAW